jgi:2-polyprenyl-3-methyl-5-hydroxy-6-metoxy-1,4-benzoquinol methylase
MSQDDLLYCGEVAEDLRLYDDRSAVCRYYHITRRNSVGQAIDAAAKRLADSHVAVDIGCGSGIYTRSFPGRFSTRIGIDLAPHKLSFARLADQFSSYVAASVFNLPIASGSADFALCSEVLEHFANPTEVLREVYRILRPKGELVLSSPNRVDIGSLVSWSVGRGPPHSSRKLSTPDMHGHYWYFAPRHLVVLLESAGFDVIDVSAVPKLHFRGLPRLLRSGVLSDHFLSRINQRLERWPRLRTFGAFLIVQARRRTLERS